MEKYALILISAAIALTGCQSLERIVISDRMYSDANKKEFIEQSQEEWDNARYEMCSWGGWQIASAGHLEVNGYASRRIKHWMDVGVISVRKFGDIYAVTQNNRTVFLKNDQKTQFGENTFARFDESGMLNVWIGKLASQCIADKVSAELKNRKAGSEVFKSPLTIEQMNRARERQKALIEEFKSSKQVKYEL